MAYSIKPTYEPMTFQEMLQPYAIYGAERDRQEEAYMKLLEDARSLEDLKDSEVDKDDYNRYIDFRNRIKAMADEIAVNGLSRQTRSNLSKYKAEYQADFANMIDRIKRRGELVKEQREYLAKAPNTFFDIDYSNTPASKVVEGSSYTPYNMDEAANSFASKVYSLMSSKNDDVTEEDMSDMIASERQKYGYDSLDDRKKAMINNALSLGIMTADKTYTDNINKQALENAKRIKAEADAYKSMYGKYKGTGAPVGRASGSVTKKTPNKLSYTFTEDGTIVEFSKSQNINGETVWTYKDSKGKSKMITQEQLDNFNNDAALMTSIHNDVSGIAQSKKVNIYGQNIEIVIDTDGNTKVKNKDGKYVVPKSFDEKGYYMAYMGIEEDKLKPYMRNQTPKRYKPDGSFMSDHDYYHDYKDNSGEGKKYSPISDFNINVSSNNQQGNSGLSIYKANYEDLKSRAGSLGAKIDDYIKNRTGNNNVKSALEELYKAGFDIHVVMYGKHANPNKRAYMEINLEYTGSGRSYNPIRTDSNQNAGNNQQGGNQENDNLPPIDD